MDEFEWLPSVHIVFLWYRCESPLWGIVGERVNKNMPKKAIIPPNMATLYRDWKMAPGAEVDGFVFLTGFNGAGLDGAISPDAATQINAAFDQVFSVLDEAGMNVSNIVEVTSYHVGLREQLEVFNGIWAERMTAPFPAWTAIEVAGFASDGVIVELRVIAHR